MEKVNNQIDNFSKVMRGCLSRVETNSAADFEEEDEDVPEFSEKQVIVLNELHY